MTTTPDSPGRFPVAINGRPYVVNLEAGYKRQSLQLFRQQADGGREFDEGSLNPEDLWRRSQVDWRMGAGIEFLDRGDITDTARDRFDWSQCIDTERAGGGRIQLQRRMDYEHDASIMGTDYRPLLLKFVGDPTAVNSDLLFCATGGTVNADDAVYLQASGGWSPAVSGLPATPLEDACTDGVNVYFACGTAGVWVWDGDIVNAATLLNDVEAARIAFVRGRLLVTDVATNTVLYNITDTSVTTPPTPLHTLSFGQTWQAFSATGSYILAAAGNGRRSTIFRISIREDGTALGAPIAAGELPDGESVTCMYGYVGVVILGSSKGVRLGQMSGGEVVYGPRIDMSRVSSITAFGNSAYVTASGIHGVAAGSAFTTGVWRLDLSRFSEDLQPAYVEGLTTDTIATVNLSMVGSAVALDDGRIAIGTCTGGVAGSGVYIESATHFEQSGDVVSGIVTYGVADPKSAERLLVKMQPLPANCTVQARVYSADTDDLLGDSGVVTSGDEIVLDFGEDGLETPGGLYVKLTLANAFSTATPVVLQWTLFANPMPRRGERIVCPLELRKDVADVNGRISHLDPHAEFLILKALEEAGEAVEYQEFGETYRCFIDTVSWDPKEFDSSNRPQGTCTVVMRRFS